MTSARQAAADSSEYQSPAEAKRVQNSLTLWPWVELARHHGVAIERLAELAEIRVADLRDPGVRFTQAAANRVAELVCERAGPDAGIQAAQTVEAGHFALIELVARTAPNVGLALAQGCRFFSLIHSEVRCVHEVEPDGSHRMRMVVPPDLSLHRGFPELTFAVWVTSLRRETEQPTLESLEVGFRHRGPEDRSNYHRVLGPGVKFDAFEEYMRFSPASAKLPLTRKNPTVHAAAVQAAKDFLRTRK